MCKNKPALLSALSWILPSCSLLDHQAIECSENGTIKSSLLLLSPLIAVNVHTVALTNQAKVTLGMELENYPEAAVETSPQVVLEVVGEISSNQESSTVSVVMTNNPIGACCEELVTPTFQIILDSEVSHVVNITVSVPSEFQNQRFLPSNIAARLSANVTCAERDGNGNWATSALIQNGTTCSIQNPQNAVAIIRECRIPTEEDSTTSSPSPSFSPSTLPPGVSQSPSLSIVLPSALPSITYSLSPTPSSSAWNDGVVYTNTSTGNNDNSDTNTNGQNLNTGTTPSFAPSPAAPVTDLETVSVVATGAVAGMAICTALVAAVSWQAKKWGNGAI